MNESLGVPDLKTSAEMRKHIQAMRGFHSRLVIVMLDVVCGVDIVAMIKKVHSV
jgi:hypothetical protein